MVTGFSDNGTNHDFYTVKYAAQNGATLWEKRYNGPANGLDGAGGSRSLALGPNGMVAITGYSDGHFGSSSGFDYAFDYATIVYLETLPPVSIALVPTGVRLHFLGVAGHSYQLLRATTVTGPWSTNSTLTAVTNGPLKYLDTNAPPGSAFYRIATGP